MLGDACVATIGEDPGTSCLGSLQQSLAQASLQLGLEFEVGLAPIYRYEQLWLLEAPLAEQEGQDQLGFGVV